MATTQIRRRRSRLRGRQENSEDNVTLDFKKEPSENLLEVLSHVVRQDGISKAKKLGYFNAFVRLVYRYGTDFHCYLSKEQILCCLRLGLFHEAKEMRAACLRALRYYISDIEAVQAFLRLHMDYLVARSLDICLDNEYERIHAMRLIRKLIQVAPSSFPRSLLTVMVSISNDGNHESDRMVKTCLATICELALLNPALVAECGGISALLHNVLDSYNFPRINESLLATVLYILNHHKTRQHVQPDVDLEQMLAPFTDCHFRFSGGGSSDHKSGEDRENIFTASKMAIVTIMRSWPGMIRLCKPDGSGLQSLLGTFCLPYMETRKEIMDILFELFRLRVPDLTNNVSLALKSIDPSSQHESWRLMEGFVAEEGKSILPHLTRTRPDLIDNHMALLLYAFINAQLLEALIEVITTSVDNISIRAAILLGEILHLANTILPHKMSMHSHCLPTLVMLATNPSSNQDELERATKAQRAVSCLTRLHTIKKQGVTPCSLFLDQILQRVTMAAEESSRAHRMSRDKLLHCLDKESHSMLIGSSVHESQVLTSRDNMQWDWDLVIAILKWPDETLKNFNDQSVQKFVRRLLYFLKPTNKNYASIEQSQEGAQKCTVAALHFVDFLLECDEGGDASKAVEELLNDIAHCLKQIQTQRCPHDALFQPSVLIHTLSQDYFLLLGRFSSSPQGEKYLRSTGVFQQLLDLVTITSHDTYIKLVISSLDYSRDGMARIILSKALTATSEGARLYATSLLRVLLRARVPYLGNWSIEMLVMQLYDQAKPVAMEALSVISEACEEEVNLHTLIKMRPSVLHLGHKGAMLLARFLSIPAGYRFLTEANYILHEVDKWHKSFNIKYVQIVEERLNEALTTYERTYDGVYTRRSSKRQLRADAFVPVHLYGQLVQHKEGFQLLEKQPYLHEYFQTVADHMCETSQDILKLKASLWALGHMGTSVWGLNLLIDESIIPDIIKIGEESPVFSLRGTAFYVLGLLASTKKGTEILHEFGWESVCHARHELWPVILEASDKNEESLDSMALSASMSSLSGRFESGRGSSLALPLHHHLHSDSDQTSPVSGTSPKSGLDIDAGLRWVKPRSNTNESVESKPRSRSNTAESRGGKSRSDTGSNPGTLGSSRESSPKVSFEGIYDDDEEEEDVDGDCLGVSPGINFTPKSGRSESEPTTKAVKVLFDTHPRSKSDPVGNKSPNNLMNTPIKEQYSDVLTSEQFTTPTLDHHQRSVGYRDERSGSNESSRTSKSHTDSVNTDTPTSGISSYDSCPTGGANDHGHLTPIPSASSLATNSSRGSNESDKQGSHPSDSVRRAANLRRVPSNRRYSNPGLGPLSPLKSLSGKRPLSESMIVYATPDDNTQGYATLRQLQRQRTLSNEAENDIGPSNLLEESNVPKTQSLDFRAGKPRESPLHFWRSLPRLRGAHGGGKQPSHQSLPDLDLNIPGNPFESLTRSASTDKLRQNEGQTGGGRAEYIGLCLPIDVSMIFHVTDDELSSDLKPKDSSTLTPTVPKDLVLQPSLSDMDQETGLEHHTTNNCLGCYRVQKDSSITIKIGHVDEDGKEETYLTSEPGGGNTVLTLPSGPSGGPSPVIRSLNKSHNSSMSDMAAQGGSVNSEASTESSRPFMCEDTEEGRVLIRKEALRFIVNLSSSISVKSSEQGLLTLKQKFNRAFQDICLYSEVSYLLANYNYRLNVRRFIQELFQDTNFNLLSKEPLAILDLEDNNSKSRSGSPPDVVSLEKVPESSA